MPGRVGADAIEKRHYDANTGQFTQQDPIGIAGGANVYGFAGGDPINNSDPFGLWSRKAHNRIIDAALGALMSTERREGLKRVSLGLDLRNTNDNFMHSLRDAGQSPADAAGMRDGFIRESLVGAASSAAKGDMKEADLIFGMAVHTIADKYSPAHTDAQGNPAVYPGPGHSKTDLTGTERSRDISKKAMDAMTQEIQAAYEQVYVKKP